MEYVAHHTPSTNPVRCYACDALATGVADRRNEHEAALVPACDRHAWRGFRLAIRSVCLFCEKPVVTAGPRRSLEIDDEWAHARCYDDACSDVHHGRSARRSA